MKTNGGSNTTQSKKSATKLQIIGDKPGLTDDMLETINYLEKIVITKDNLKNLDLTKLVRHINRALQYIEVLATYKAPTYNILNYYNELVAKSQNPSLKGSLHTLYLRRANFLGEVISRNITEQYKVKRKDYWEDYE